MTNAKQSPNLPANENNVDAEVLLRRKPLIHRIVRLLHSSKTRTSPFSAFERDKSMFVSFRLEDERRQFTEQLEKIRLILKYLHEKMSDHQLPASFTSDLTPITELTSPLYNPITPYEEQTILSSFMDERDHPNEVSMKKSIYEPGIAIAMKLPRNFTPLNLQSTTSNDIIHSPRFQTTPIEYKKELPSDIIDRYAGVSKHSKQQQQQATTSSSHAKKGKKARKVSSLLRLVRANNAPLTIEFRYQTFAPNDQPVR